MPSGPLPPSSPLTNEQQRLAAVLADAGILLWDALVRRSGDSYAWQFQVAPESLQSPLLAYTNYHASGWLWHPSIVPEYDRLENTYRAALARGDDRYQQQFRVCRDGRTMWVDELVRIVPTAPNEWRFSGIVREITEQKLARDAEVQLQKLLQHVDCIVWEAFLVEQPDGSWRWRIQAPPSRLYRRLFHCDPDQPYVEVFWTPEATPEYHEMERRWRAAIAANESSYEQEFRHITDGVEVWLHESVTILRRDPGVIRLAGVVVDITARKRAEEGLNAQKERLAVTLRAMEEAVVTVDADGRITFLNRAAETLFRVEATAALNRSMTEVGALRRVNTGTAVPWPVPPANALDLPGDVELLRAEAPPLRIEGCIAPLRDPTTPRHGAVIVLRDVTDRHLLQAQLQRASTLESVGILAGGIAHDFNNILTALLGNLNLAEMEVPPGSPLDSYLREAHAATDRAAALAKQLLTFAKGGDPLLGAVNLPDVIHEVARFTLRGTKVDYVADLAPDLWPVQADRGQLAQIIQNLVLNAAQAMPEGGTVRLSAVNENITVTRGTLRPNRYLRLTITDTGTGIPADSLNNIFTPYFTTKPGGHGLGLAVVYSIVRKHRGSIDVQSTPGAGTTFELRLPAASGKLATGAQDARPGAQRMHGRVLVMDDEPAILRVLGTYLRRLGLDVETALDGQQAVDLYQSALARNRRFDIVVMDLTVPGKMGGQEAIAALRKLDPSVRAIVASGYSRDPVLARYRDYGFVAMAAKPYDIDALAATIGELLERGREGRSRDEE